MQIVTRSKLTSFENIFERADLREQCFTQLGFLLALFNTTWNERYYDILVLLIFILKWSLSIKLKNYFYEILFPFCLFTILEYLDKTRVLQNSLNCYGLCILLSKCNTLTF